VTRAHGPFQENDPAPVLVPAAARVGFAPEGPYVLFEFMDEDGIPITYGIAPSLAEHMATDIYRSLKELGSKDDA